jgi:hypothetical protein
MMRFPGSTITAALSTFSPHLSLRPMAGVNIPAFAEAALAANKASATPAALVVIDLQHWERLPTFTSNDNQLQQLAQRFSTHVNVYVGGIMHEFIPDEQMHAKIAERGALMAAARAGWQDRMPVVIQNLRHGSPEVQIDAVSRLLQNFLHMSDEVRIESLTALLLVRYPYSPAHSDNAVERASEVTQQELAESPHTSALEKALHCYYYESQGPYVNGHLHDLQNLTRNADPAVAYGATRELIHLLDLLTRPQEGVDFKQYEIAEFRVIANILLQTVVRDEEPVCRLVTDLIAHDYESHPKRFRLIWKSVLKNPSNEGLREKVRNILKRVQNTSI